MAKLEDHEPVTLRLPRAHVSELKRRTLEHPRYRRYKGVNSHADLIREAVALYLEQIAKHGMAATALAAAPPSNTRPALAIDSGDDEDDDLPIVIHWRAPRHPRSTMCGRDNLEPERLTDHGENATCTACREAMPRTHFRIGEGKTMCGLAGVESRLLKRVDAEVTCPKCAALLATNARTMARPTPATKARPSSRRRSKATTKKPAAKSASKGARR